VNIIASDYYFGFRLKMLRSFYALLSFDSAPLLPITASAIPRPMHSDLLY
jgi:hypothetical protein